MFEQLGLADVAVPAGDAVKPEKMGQQPFLPGKLSRGTARPVYPQDVFMFRNIAQAVTDCMCTL